jgi:ClpP class serine protease
MWYPFRPRPPLVALVRLEGLIAARTGPFGGLNAAGVNPILERAFGLKRLQAVILAINSPGGSPVQSSLIARRIRQLAEEKKVPVIAVPRMRRPRAATGSPARRTRSSPTPPPSSARSA